MFGFGRVSRRKKRKHVVAYYPIIAVTCAIEFLLALSAAFLIDDSVQLTAHKLLEGIAPDLVGKVLAGLLSFVLGVCFMIAGIWTFSGFMKTLYDFIAWAKARKVQWPIALPWTIAGAIVILDWVSLGFRAQFLSNKGEIWLLVFFVLLPPLVWGLGVFMYILETIPEDQRLANLRQDLEQVHIDELESAALDMDPELLSEWMNDDPAAITTHYERVKREREEARQQELDAIAQRDAEKQESKPKPLPLPKKLTFFNPLRERKSRNA